MFCVNDVKVNLFLWCAQQNNKIFEKSHILKEFLDDSMKIQGRPQREGEAPLLPKPKKLL